MLEGDLASRYTGACARCGADRRFELRIPEATSPRPRPGSSSAAPSPPSCSIPASGSASPTITPAGSPSAPCSMATPSVRRVTDLAVAIAAIDEIRKFAPPGAAEVPSSAFFSPLGRATWDKEPGRFRVVRLQAVRKAYVDAAAQL